MSDEGRWRRPEIVEVENVVEIRETEGREAESSSEIKTESC